MRQTTAAPSSVRRRSLVRRAATGAAVVACACGLTACGRTPPHTSGGPSASATGSVVSSAQVPGLGRVLVTSKDYTLYLYTPDDRGPSTCTAQCAVVWPPLLLPSSASTPTASAGVRQDLLGTVRRADGRLQVTYDGWPLYLYWHDGPGRPLGQGRDGLWYAVTTSGAAVRASGSS